MSIYTLPYHAKTVSILDNGESKKYSCLSDERGFVYSKEEILLLFEQIKEFYEHENTDELVKSHNRLVEISNKLHEFTKEVTVSKNNKYLIPPAQYKYKEFKQDKKDWSCKCGWCGNKVSSKTDKGWYSIHNFYLRIISERACSENCAQLIWKESVENWIHENKYQEFFDY